MVGMDDAEAQQAGILAGADFLQKAAYRLSQRLREFRVRLKPPVPLVTAQRAGRGQQIATLDVRQFLYQIRHGLRADPKSRLVQDRNRPDRLWRCRLD